MFVFRAYSVTMPCGTRTPRAGENRAISLRTAELMPITKPSALRSGPPDIPG